MRGAHTTAGITAASKLSEWLTHDLTTRLIQSLPSHLQVNVSVVPREEQVKVKRVDVRTTQRCDARTVAPIDRTAVTSLGRPSECEREQLKRAKSNAMAGITCMFENVKVSVWV